MKVHVQKLIFAGPPGENAETEENDVTLRPTRQYQCIHVQAVSASQVHIITCRGYAIAASMEMLR